MNFFLSLGVFKLRNHKLVGKPLFWLVLIPGRSRDQGFSYWMESPLPPTSSKLTLESLYTQIMLVLILIDVHFLQNVVFNFEKGWNAQNHSFSDPHHSIKISLQKDFLSCYLGIFPLQTLHPMHFNQSHSSMYIKEECITT